MLDDVKVYLEEVKNAKEERLLRSGVASPVLDGVGRVIDLTVIAIAAALWVQ